MSEVEGAGSERSVSEESRLRPLWFSGRRGAAPASDTTIRCACLSTRGLPSVCLSVVPLAVKNVQFSFSQIKDYKAKKL